MNQPTKADPKDWLPLLEDPDRDFSLWAWAYLWCGLEPPSNRSREWGYRTASVTLWLQRFCEAAKAGKLKIRSQRRTPAPQIVVPFVTGQQQPRPETTAKHSQPQVSYSSRATVKEMRRYAKSINHFPELLFPPKTDGQPEARPTKKKCRECGKSFVPKRKNSKTCSPECQKERDKRKRRTRMRERRDPNHPDFNSNYIK